MRNLKITALIFSFLWIGTVAHAQSGTKISQMPSAGSVIPTDALPIVRGGINFQATVPFASTTTGGLSICGSGLACSSTGVMSVTTTGLSPNGPTGSPQINNAGSLYGPPIPPTGYMATSSATNLGSINPKAEAAITSGLRIDPRGYGAKCTGMYGVASVTIATGGTGFAVNDTFLMLDDNLSNQGGYVAVPGTGHVTAASSGVVTAVAIDTPGSGYNTGEFYVIPTSGVGIGLLVNVTDNSRLYVPPSAPTVTLASAGGATGAAPGGYNHLAANSYNVSDLFALPNSLGDGNYLVGVVDTITTNHGIATFHFYNWGGDFAVASGVAAITLTGSGGGATFNITSATSSNHTFDDTYGLVNGEVVSREAGGILTLPDGCWSPTWPQVPYAVVVGANDAPSNGYGTNFQTGNVDPGGARRAPILSMPGGTQAYAIDLNGASGGVLRGFQIIPHVQCTGSGGGCPYSNTIGIGSSVHDPFSSSGGNGAGAQSPWFIDRIAAHYFKYGIGTQGSSDPLVFLKLHQNDWGGGAGCVFGALSDLVEEDDTCTSTKQYCTEITGGGGSRIGPDNRCEFSKGGYKFDGFGAISSNVWDDQVTFVDECGVFSNGSEQITVSGGNFTSVGLAGTFSVTGAANNGSGLIRLAISGEEGTTDVVTGDVATVRNVTGTTEANGIWTITVIDGSHIDLQSSTFTNAYVSGGKVGIRFKDAYWCSSNGTGFYITGAGTYGYGSGFNGPSAFVIDSTGSTNINITGGGPTSVNDATDFASYTMGFANWGTVANIPPANTHIDVLRHPFFDNANYPTITGISLTNTGGGLNQAFGLSGTTTTGTVTFSNLPVNANGYNCDGGDSTIGNSWPMLGATTSTSTSLSVITTSGNSVHFGCHAR